MPRKFDNWITAYLDYSSHSEAPTKFHFWTAVSCIAGALRRRVWIDQGYFQWTPNFYIVFVAPPGIVSKSTTASIGVNLLRDVPDIKFGPDAVTWQALTEALAAALEEPFYNGNHIQMSCITISSSEFGTFLNPSDREMVDVLVSLWDGQLTTWEKRTKTQGSDSIVNPWINIIACTTPSWIAGNFPQYMIGGGFTSRCVFVYAEEKRHLVAYPGQHIGKDFQQQAADLKHDLEAISLLLGSYTMTPEALEFGEKWYEEHYDKARQSKLDNSKWGGYFARKQTHIHKLAMILAAAKREELVITVEDLQEANHFVTELEQDMPKVFQLIGRSDSAEHSQAVYNVVRQHKAIDQVVLYRELFQLLGTREIEEGIKSALSAGLVQRMEKGGRIVLVDAAISLAAGKPQEPAGTQERLSAEAVGRALSSDG